MELIPPELLKGYGGLVYGLIGLHLFAFVVWLYLLGCSRKPVKESQD